MRVIYLSLVLYLTVLLLNFPSDKEQSKCVRIIADTTSGIPHYDNPLAAEQFETERTKDPALGYVPRERLQEAYAYMQRINSENQNPSLKAASPALVWSERGPNNCGGRTRAIMVDPNDGTKKTVWAAGVDGGLWKTTDITVANPVWTPINDFFTNMAITTIAYNPASTQTMYFGTGEGWYNVDAVRGNGIWKSTDGGTTWSQLAATNNNSNFDNVSKIVVDATGNVYAATRSRYCNRGGIFRSTDGGTSWSLVLGTQGADCASSNCYGDDVEVAASGTIYAALGSFNKSDGVYSSATGNPGSWTKLNTGANGFPTANIARIEIACAPSSAVAVYAMVESMASGGLLNIYRTTNSGTTWTTCALPSWRDQNCGVPSTDMTRQQAWYDLAIAVDPNTSTTLFVGGVDLFKSTNSGTAWTQITNWAGLCSYQYVHADQHAVVFESGNSNVIYFGNDGGIYATTNGTAGTPTITSKVSSYNVTQFYSVAVHPSNPNYFLAGAQDNGSHKFTAAGMNSTSEVSGGDGAFVHIDQNNATYQFTSYVYSNYYRSTNGGTSFNYVGFNNNGSFINPSDYDNSQFKFYAAYSAGNYFRWDDPRTGATAFALGVAAFGGGMVSAVTVSPNTTNRVFFGINNGRVVRVDNAHTGTPTSTNITGAGMPAGTVSCIEVQTGNDNHIIATYSNYGVNSVWETTNGGASWTSVEGNLPDMPVRWALFNPYDPTQLYLATELGVWSAVMSGGATSWLPDNAGLANVRVDMLQLRSSDNLLAAATHGRGMYTTTIQAALPIELTEFRASCAGQGVELIWTTVSEKNNDFFSLERSSKGDFWETIAHIPGAGNSNSSISYNFLDIKPSIGILYYRLKQTDYNGAYTYSDLISIRCQDNPSYNLQYVDVFSHSNEININFNSDEGGACTVRLYNMDGSLLAVETSIAVPGANTIMLNPGNISKGIYLLNLQIHGNSISKKIIIM